MMGSEQQGPMTMKTTTNTGKNQKFNRKVRKAK